MPGLRPGLTALLGGWIGLCGAAGSPAADWSGGGPEIGWVYTLMEASDGFLYAGTWGGGIFRSADGGDHWAEATTNAPDAVVVDLLEGVDPARTLYAATADQALLRKERGSDFWLPLVGYPTGTRPAGMSVERFPTQDLRIVFGHEDGGFISNTRGSIWPDTLVIAAGQVLNDLLVVPEIPNTIHALTAGGLVVTSDSGQSEQYYSAGLAGTRWLQDIEPWPGSADSMLSTLR